MLRARPAGVVGFLVLLTLGSTIAWGLPKVIVQAEPEFDPAAYTTFSFAMDAPTPSGKQIPVTPLQQVVRDAIVRELTALGWTRAAKGEVGDVLVTFGGAGQPTLREGGIWVFDETGISVYGTRAAFEGWFTIAIAEPGAGNALWQGYTKGAIGPSEDMARRKLVKITRRILRRLR